MKISGIKDNKEQFFQLMTKKDHRNFVPGKWEFVFENREMFSDGFKNCCDRIHDPLTSNQIHAADTWKPQWRISRIIKRRRIRRIKEIMRIRKTRRIRRITDGGLNGLGGLGEVGGLLVLG